MVIENPDDEAPVKHEDSDLEILDWHVKNPEALGTVPMTAMMNLARLSPRPGCLSVRKLWVYAQCEALIGKFLQVHSSAIDLESEHSRDNSFSTSGQKKV